MRRTAWLGLFLLACSNGSAKPQPQDPPEQQARDASTADADPSKLEGAALYQTYCSQCHGPDAKGYKADNAPSLVNKTFLESASDEFIHKSIAVGRPGTSMAGYASDIGGPLDHMAIGRIVRWLRAQGPQAEPLAATPAKGNENRGAAVYAAECQKCHGDATTRVNAVHLANPQFLALASDAFIRHAVVYGRPGTPMLPFEGKLTPQQIDDVVAYVRAFGKPPEVAKAPEPGKTGKDAKDAKAAPAQPNVEVVEPTPPTGKEPLVINPKGKAPVWKATRPDPATGKPRFVSVDEVKRAMDEKRKMVIIDARPPSDWMRARIKGAVSIPYHDLKRVSEIPKDTWVIAYCACPHHLSGIVVEELWKRGHERALVLDEGVLEWHRRGYPMVTAPGVPVPPKEDHSGHNHGHSGHGH